jgi:peroxiredoxin
MLLGQIVRIALNADATVAGARCRVLVYETLQGAKLTNYIDATRSVLLKVEAETSPNAPTTLSTVVSPPQPVTRLSYELSPVELNPGLTGVVFAYKPPAGFKQVAQIGAADDPLIDPQPARIPPAAETGGGHLIGKPAPPVSGKDLAGKSVAPAELQGRTVLLFFWSIGGGEHSLRSIPVVQSVADHFKDRPQILVLGVSGDADQAEVVGQLMERKKAAFRTLLDEEMKVQRSFELGGVPTFVVVGPDGTVKWARLGAPPSLKEEKSSSV